MAVRFVPDPRGIALIARTPAMAASMLGKAGDVRDNAKAVAPYGEGEGGHYRDMITADANIIDGIGGARVNARKFTSGFIEFGTSDTPIFAPLRLGVDAAGLTLTEGE